jgi:hypothetical protein
MSYYQIKLALINVMLLVRGRTNITLMYILDYPRGHGNQSVGLMVSNAESWPWILRRIIALHIDREVWRNGGGGLELGM